MLIIFSVRFYLCEYLQCCQKSTAKVPFIFVDGADTGRTLGDEEGALCDIAPT